MRRVITVILISFIVPVLGFGMEPQRGYRGFIDWDNSIGKMNYFDNAEGKNVRDTQWLIGVSTSHGFQFNRNIFLGGGLMFSVATPSADIMLPVFVDFRYDLSLSKFTPFGDVRLGFNLSDGGGVYFSPTIGYRLNFGRKVNMNFGLGFTLRGYSSELYRVDLVAGENGEDPYYMATYMGKKHHSNAMFTIRIGFDF